MKKLIIIVFILFIIGFAVIYINKKGKISGVIKDCTSGQKISNASIRSRQIGWGFSPSLIWDKVYDVNTTSDENGYFSIKVPLKKPSQLLVTKNGYVDAIEAIVTDEEKEVKILSGDPKSFNKPVGYIIYTKNCVIQ